MRVSAYSPIFFTWGDVPANWGKSSGDKDKGDTVSESSGKVVMPGLKVDWGISAMPPLEVSPKEKGIC